MPLYLVFYFWLLVISAFVFTLERLFPWRPKQEALRGGFVQDLFWMVFNTQYLSWMLAIAAVNVVTSLNAAFLHLGLPAPDTVKLISHWPWWLQFVVFFLIKDFLEWNIHRWLHQVPWLWKFHQLHHSIEELDWAATFRSHWVEIIIYKLLIYLPLVVLGVDETVVFVLLVCSLLFQELNHANVKWGGGPLRYVINSPRFHAWHHDIELRNEGGQNFGVNLTIWDWLFGTAHWPDDAEAPTRYGFEGIEAFPKSFWSRLWSPFISAKRTRSIGIAGPPAPTPDIKKAARAKKSGG
jgi:sterol desaturase/sphingolipid hydroxylase (fatty acid hydroxylase superfamily)